jgi:hypothetical protein
MLVGYLHLVKGIIDQNVWIVSNTNPAPRLITGKAAKELKAKH